MFNLQNLAVAIALILFGWYFVGSYLNRRRSGDLINAIRTATAKVGSKPAIKWFGRTAFQVDIGEPRAPFAGVHLLCILEPRDFAIAQAWNRIRGRRDQLVIHADFNRPPKAPGKPEATAYGIKGLTGVELKVDQPHLQMNLQVPKGGEGAIAQCLDLAQQLAK